MEDRAVDPRRRLREPRGRGRARRAPRPTCCTSTAWTATTCRTSRSARRSSQSLRPHTDLFLDCHLMVDNPGVLLDDFAEAGADGCTVHVELGDPRPLFDRDRARSACGVGLVVRARDAVRRGRAVPRRDRPPARDERAHRASAVSRSSPRCSTRCAPRARTIDERGLAGRDRDRRRHQDRQRAARGRGRRRHPRVGHAASSAPTIPAAAARAIRAAASAPTAR